MSKLIILRGNSGSGKTTIAKELQNAQMVEEKRFFRCVKGKNYYI